MSISISWRNLRGVKTYYKLEPKMLRGKVRRSLTTRPCPYSRYQKGTYKVSFDRDYAVEKIRRDIITPLKECKLKDILELAIEAYAIDCPDAKTCGIEINTHE